MTRRNKKIQKSLQAENTDRSETPEAHETSFKDEVWDFLESIDNTTGKLILGIRNTVLIINMGRTVEIVDDDNNPQPISIKKKDRYVSPYIFSFPQKGHVLTVS